MTPTTQGVTIRRAVGTTPPADQDVGRSRRRQGRPGHQPRRQRPGSGTTYSYALFAHDEVPNHAAAATGQGDHDHVGRHDTAGPGHVGDGDRRDSSSLTLTLDQPR